jgi:class 3 adenylate cyclase
MAIGTPARSTVAMPPLGVLVLLVLPLAGLGLLLARPEVDMEWEHHPSHFWLVLGTAAVNVVLASITNIASGRYRDARVALISLAFMVSAGFLGLHALATPGVLLSSPNVGFVIATPVGLAIASMFAFASTSAIAGPGARAVLRARPLLFRGLVLLMGLWAALSLARLPPLDGPPPSGEGVGALTVLGIGSVGLYAIAAWRSLERYREVGGVVVLAVAAAFVLLAEAMVAIVVSRNWHLSWWEWHVLMLAAFVAIAVGVRREYQRSGSLSGAFGGLYLEATLARIDRWHARAIASVASAEARGRSVQQAVDQLRREGATVDEVALVEQAARELRRLDEAFRPYLSSVAADRVRRAGPDASFSGEERIVSVVFADLAGFTAFSETRTPTEVVTMLNEYWAVIVPVIEAAGGSIEHFAGDGIMVIFDAAGDQPDHVARAARAARGILEASRPIAEAHPDRPIFRVGVNTGPAVVGDVGAMGRRSFTVIGDTTNTAARLMAAGEPGQIVVGRDTWEGLGPDRVGTALGPVTVKGKRDPVEAWILRGP